MATWGLGAHLGNMEGNLEGNLDGNLEGNLEGNLQGNLVENLEWNLGGTCRGPGSRGHLQGHNRIAPISPISGLSHLPYWDRLQAVGMTSTERRQERYRVIYTPTYNQKAWARTRYKSDIF